MSKQYSRFITILFCAVLGVFFLAVLLTPKRDFSPAENRYLQTFPKFSADSLLSGKFMSQFETFITDQFPGRDGWVGAKASMERMSGKKENNGVYFCAQDTLIARLDEPDEERLSANLGYVQTLAEKAEIPVYFSLIPGAGHVWADRLPANAPSADQSALLIRAQQDTPAARWIDLERVLIAHRDEDIFYRTDHHWTSLGARYACQALVDAMGLPAPTDKALFTKEGEVVSDSFYGTNWSTSGVRWVSPDSIVRYADDAGVTVESYPNGTAEQGALYHPEKLEEKNKYPYFLGGNQPLCILRNENRPNGPKVLIVRDSYSDTLAPMLIQSCGELHLFDVRYNLNSVAQYAAEHGIDAVLVLYSTANFVSENNMFVLGR
ncbi:MAG: hypothetical protein HFF09_03530 [Oscillospiraceae bacterium]|nr:hypothetical protein [Oscillospiraceae bacterium]